MMMIIITILSVRHEKGHVYVRIKIECYKMNWFKVRTFLSWNKLFKPCREKQRRLMKFQEKCSKKVFYKQRMNINTNMASAKMIRACGWADEWMRVWYSIASKMHSTIFLAYIWCFLRDTPYIAYAHVFSLGVMINIGISKWQEKWINFWCLWSGECDTVNTHWRSRSHTHPVWKKAITNNWIELIRFSSWAVFITFIVQYTVVHTRTTLTARNDLRGNS